jgi:hypothetical protein
MEVSVPNVPGRINNGPEDFVLNFVLHEEITPHRALLEKSVVAQLVRNIAHL